VVFEFFSRPYLEADFYAMGLDSGIIPSGKEQTIFQLIKDLEMKHVDFLKMAIESLNCTPVDKPEFDFTAGGTFNPFGDYQQLAKP